MGNYQYLKTLWFLNLKTSCFLPGYGILPYVTISVSRIPKDQMSDLMLNVP